VKNKLYYKAIKKQSLGGGLLLVFVFGGTEDGTLGFMLAEVLVLMVLLRFFQDSSTYNSISESS
jgi:hypothetical protein